MFERLFRERGLPANIRSDNEARWDDCGGDAVAGVASAGDAVMLNAATGQATTLSVPTSSLTNTQGQTTNCDCFTPVRQPMVDSDGTTYLEYEVRQVASNTPTAGVLSLMKIASDGTMSSVQLGSSNVGNLWLGQVIPDGSGGVLATWAEDHTFQPMATQPYKGANVSSAGTIVASYDMPMGPTNILRDNNTGIPLELQMVLGENGTGFVSYVANIASFVVSTGALNWNYSAPAGKSIVVGEVNGGPILRLFRIIRSSKSEYKLVQVGIQGGSVGSLPRSL